MTAHFLYLFDPLCGWCYGASAGIAALAKHPGVTVETLPTGCSPAMASGRSAARCATISLPAIAASRH